MAVEIETYEMEEVFSDKCAEEIEPEALALIEKLGMKGQAEILSPKSGAKPQVRIPFRKMKSSEMFVYQTLCPERSDLESYNAQPIPFRVLSLINLCKENNYFQEIYIWDADQGHVKDPVLVGFTEDQWTNQVPYLLARWGEHLEEFPALLKQAKDELLVRVHSKMNGTISDLGSLFGLQTTTYPHKSNTF